jgi:hypothetical protein
MEDDEALDVERGALRARLAALRSGDEAAVLGALAALAAPAYALPPPNSDQDDQDNDDDQDEGGGNSPHSAPWLRWLTLAGAGLTPLCAALAPLLLDARFTDAALALAVPLAAAFAYATDAREGAQTTQEAYELFVRVQRALEGRRVDSYDLRDLAEPLITLLLTAVASLQAAEEHENPAASAEAVLLRSRTARVLRVLCDCANFEYRMNLEAPVSVLNVKQPELRAALLQLLWLAPPSDGANVLGGGAAQMLLFLTDKGIWEQDPDITACDIALLRAALAALQEPWSDVTLDCAWGGFAYGSAPVLHTTPARALTELLSSAMCTEFMYVAGRRELTKLILPQPGALAAIVHAVVMAGDAQLLSQLTTGAEPEAPPEIEVEAAPHLQAHALCQSALLDGELCLGELLSPRFGALPGGAADVQARFARACSDAAALELLARPPRGAALPAAVALAMLAAWSPGAAAALPRGDALRTLARAYCRACTAPPWRAPGVQRRDAAALRQRHGRLRCALSAAAAAASAAAQQHAHTLQPPPPSPAAKRLRAGCSLLSASDVNVRRHDSLTLLVSGEPLYVNSMLMEKASPLLADLISGVLAAAATSATAHPGMAPAPLVLPLPAPADVACDALHALMCAAVEHTYTGALPDALPRASLPPLWCVARQLQLEALRRACVDALSPAVLRCAPRELLSRTADVALRHGCDTALLCNAVAALLLSDDAAKPAAPLSETDDDLIAAMLCCADDGTGAGAAALADALGDAMAAVMRQALLPGD